MNVMDDTIQKPAMENDFCNEQDSVVVKSEDEEYAPNISKDKIQLCVDRKEIFRRISAFASLKRKEIDECNVQEFCGHHVIDEADPAWELSGTCARVDAIFVPKFGNKSRVKVSRVENLWGPQTQQKEVSFQHNIKQENLSSSECAMENVEERLRNMETFLKLKSDSTSRRTIYDRLKMLENRILHLESLSPDYFANTGLSSPLKQSSIEKHKGKAFNNLNINEIEKRMQILKEQLQNKSRQQLSDL